MMMGRCFSPFFSALIAGILLLNLAGTAFAVGKSIPRPATGRSLMRPAQRALPPAESFLVEKDGTERTLSLENKRPGKRRPLFLRPPADGLRFHLQPRKTVRALLTNRDSQLSPYFSFHRKLSPPTASEEPFVA